MKGLRMGLILLLCICGLCLSACGGEEVGQLDYTTLDMEMYGEMSPALLEEIVLTIPNSCQYSEKRWEDYLTNFFETYPKVTYVTTGKITSSSTLCFYYNIAVEGDVFLSYGEKDGSPLTLNLENGRFMGIEGFANHLVGKGVGDTTSFSMMVPQDHTIDWLAGREATFTITSVALREEEILTAFDSDYILNTLGWQTTLTDPKMVVDTFVSSLKEEFIAAYEEDRYHAIEDALMAYLKEVYVPYTIPMEEMAYHFRALLSYYESMRVYDNEVLTLWGNEEGVSPTLSDYLMRSFSVSAIEGYQTLLAMAEEMVRENVTLAAAYHALGLTITQEEYEEMATLLEEEGEDPTPSYVRNVILYEKTVATLMDSNRVKILYSEM